MTVAHKCGPSTTVFSQRVSKTKRSGSSDLIRANPGARIDCFRRVASVAQKGPSIMKNPGEGWNDSIGGFIIVDSRCRQILYSNQEAVRILVYPQPLPKIKGL